MDVGEEFGRAVRAFQAGDLRTAERACGKILRKTPRHLPALALLGGVHFQSGDLDAGIKTVRTLLRFKPDDVGSISATP